MDHRDGFFMGPRGMKIYCQQWQPREAPKAALLVVHGLGEHCGRYGNIVGRFVSRGYAVHAFDHIGHGRSEGVRVYVERFDDYTDTLGRYADTVRSERPELPLFLVGHSMGGLIAASYLIDRQAGLAGAVLSGPGVKVPDSISPLVIAVGKVLSRLAPKMGVVRLDAAGISRDPAVVQAYCDDPLVHRGKITARLGAEMLAAMQRVRAEAGRITLPLLIVQGGADRMIDPGGADMLYSLVGSADKMLHVYNGLYHEVFNEPEHPRVLDDVETWLEAHLTGS